MNYKITCDQYKYLHGKHKLLQQFSLSNNFTSSLKIETDDNLAYHHKSTHVSRTNNKKTKHQIVMTTFTLIMNLAMIIVQHVHYTLHNK